MDFSNGAVGCGKKWVVKKKEKVDRGSVVNFSKDWLKTFWTVIGHWTVRNGDEFALVNQLSESKIYPHCNVNKSSNDRFFVYGFYWLNRKHSFFSS